MIASAAPSLKKDDSSDDEEEIELPPHDEMKTVMDQFPNMSMKWKKDFTVGTEDDAIFL